MFEYIEGDRILFRDYNSQNKWSMGIVQKKTDNLHCLIEYNGKVRMKHLDQLCPYHIISSKKSSHNSGDIVLEVPSEYRKLPIRQSPCVSQLLDY